MAAQVEENAAESEPESFLGVAGGWSKNEQCRKAEERLTEGPLDIESWNVLLREAQTTPIGKARVIYEKLVQYFPTVGKYWKLWAEHELKFKNFDLVEKIFRQCLMSVLSYDLWRFYINYVKETKAVKPEFRAILSQTYEFTLQHVGLDPRSTSIWQEYLHFLKEGEATNSFAEEQKVSAIRKVYQEACSQPLVEVDTIWKDYQAFEQGVNKVLGSKLIEERKATFLLARKCSSEYEELSRSLTRAEVALPPKGTAVELQQKKKWQQYLEWEKSNPMHYSDCTRVAKRVTFAYKQCLLQFVHHADVWCATAHYLEGVGRQLAEKQPGDGEVLLKEVRDLYKKALSMHLPRSTLLHFAYADFEESQGQKDAAQEVYEGLLQLEGMDPTLIYIQYLRFAKRTGGVKAARNVFRKAREDARTGYQVFVAAAMMEYFCSKDANIAFKVFELGLKRYGENIDYILSYIDYISHQNEENNTRALFHRVLATLPLEQSGEILTRFAEFETNTGDLTSIQKVEADKERALKESYRMSEGVLLVDRYKYLDLYPCSEMELVAMEHPDVTMKASKAGIRGGVCEEDGHLLVEVVRPDLTQMLPFKPSAICGVGLNAVPGGFFPTPEAVASLMQRLPPPECFKGPFVDVGKLMEAVVRNVPEHPHSTSTLELRGKIKANEEKASRKRPAGESGDAVVTGGTNGTVPPTLDLFRARQQKRANLGSN